MNDLLLKRCGYCDKQFTATVESNCCSNLCQDKYSKYMNLREKYEDKLNFIYITLWGMYFLIQFISADFPEIMYYSFSLLLLFSLLNIIFPFGEDKGLEKRGIKKTKILIRSFYSIILILGIIIYLKDFLMSTI